MNYIKWSVAILCLIIVFILLSKIKIFNSIDQLDSNQSEKKLLITESADNNNTAISSNKQKNFKNILYWHKMFSTYDFYLGLGSDLFVGCPYSNCYTSHDKNYLPSIDQWDAIVFHGVEYEKNVHGVPAVRSQDQIYVMYDLESPIYNYRRNLRDLGDFFNMTMTYRSDSDIYHPYGNAFPSKTNYTPPTREDVASKQKNKLAWFVSRCSSQSQRELLVSELNKTFSVDVYGKCGTLSCSRTNEEECYQMLEMKYKFYLSFENSFCMEYVTEKLFKILNLNVVPIVYGGANYSRVTPPHSVINVRDFESVADLVKYIEFLDNNPEEYLKYFEWKKHYRVEANLQLGKCNLCKALNEQQSGMRSYPDIDKWWRTLDDKSVCSNSFMKKFLNTV